MQGLKCRILEAASIGLLGVMLIGRTEAKQSFPLEEISSVPLTSASPGASNALVKRFRARRVDEVGYLGSSYRHNTIGTTSLQFGAILAGAVIVCPFGLSTLPLLRKRRVGPPRVSFPSLPCSAPPPNPLSAFEVRAAPLSLDHFSRESLKASFRVAITKRQAGKPSLMGIGELEDRLGHFSNSKVESSSLRPLSRAVLTADSG